jgi:predicted RNase H-like HicB family nuclease
MLTEYLQAALKSAHHEIIQDEEPYYGEIPGLEGLWATGPTLETCRKNLAKAVEDWLVFSLAKGLPIPPFGDISINLPEKRACESHCSS